MEKTSNSKPKTTYQIRNAQATDVDAMVPLIHSSGPKAWDYVFDEGPIDSKHFLASAFTKHKNTISYSNHYVASIGDKVVGSILGYKQPSFLILTLGTFFRICSIYKFDFRKVVSRGLKVETMIQPPKFGCLYLAHIAVSENARKLGIAKAMIRHVINIEKSFDKISLDVSLENEPAIKLYESLGFKVIETRALKTNPAGIPDHHYMEVTRDSFKH
jgi:ribosomal protein S18 acetylase RimI-like enzyme